MFWATDSGCHGALMDEAGMDEAAVDLLGLLSHGEEVLPNCVSIKRIMQKKGCCMTERFCHCPNVVFRHIRLYRTVLYNI